MIKQRPKTQTYKQIVCNFILKYKTAVQSNKNKFKIARLSIVPQHKQMSGYCFGKMNYNRIYNELIERSRNENRQKGCGIYYENHHIIPKCLGGEDTSENLVLLTAREHFIAHWLLTKIYPSEPKIIFAFNSFSMKLGGAMNQHYQLDTYSTSRNYEYARRKVVQLLTGVPRPPHISEGLMDTTYVNNGVESRRIGIEELFNYLNSGWSKGRISWKRKEKLNKKQYKYHPNPNYRCTEERKEIARINKRNNPQGWISKDEVSKQIFVKDYPKYEKDGWILGERSCKQDKNNPNHRIFMKQQNIYIRIKQSKKQQYLDCGWIEVSTYEYLLNKEELDD